MHAGAIREYAMITERAIFANPHDQPSLSQGDGNVSSRGTSLSDLTRGRHWRSPRSARALYPPSKRASPARDIVLSFLLNNGLQAVVRDVECASPAAAGPAFLQAFYRCDK
jgi:hypothetical protein